MVGVPLPRSSQYRAQYVIEAARKAPRLNHRKVLVFDTQMIYIGWDAAAVEKAASEHLAGERERKRGPLSQAPREKRLEVTMRRSPRDSIQETPNPEILSEDQMSGDGKQSDSNRQRKRHNRL